MRKKANMYEKILKALKNGNSVEVFVSYKGGKRTNRIRLITPRACRWMHIEDDRFTPSCFMKEIKYSLHFNRWIKTPIKRNPNTIVEAMKKYDRGSFQIQHVNVLEK